VVGVQDRVNAEVRSGLEAGELVVTGTATAGAAATTGAGGGAAAAFPGGGGFAAGGGGPPAGFAVPF